MNADFGAVHAANLEELDGVGIIRFQHDTAMCALVCRLQTGAILELKITKPMVGFTRDQIAGANHSQIIHLAANGLGDFHVLCGHSVCSGW